MVFAKTPIPGKVKTRLIPTLGAQEAAKLHTRLIERTLSLCSNARISPVELWCTPDTAHPSFQQYAHEFAVDLHTQQGRDLGERMHHALSYSLDRYPYAVLIGSDCPSLTHDLLRQAFSLLDRGMEAVIAPAEDDGYVLLGLRRLDAALFTGIPWGTGRVMEITRRRLEQLDWRWQELPVQWDVDRPEDVARLELLPGSADLWRE